MEDLRKDLKTLIGEKISSAGLHFSRLELVAIIFLVSLLLLGGGILHVRSKSATSVKEITPIEQKTQGAKKPLEVVVHVCGAVKAPGVYELSGTKRVTDAIQIAGGPTPEANLDALNLAAKLVDGQKIYVPKEGESISPTLSGNGTVDGPINLNTASVEQLDQLPGIGPVLAQRIIEYRESNGGFKSIDDLQKVEGIGPKKFEQIKDKVTVN
ncbi:MAG: ComEA family DNA-binding protein [Actinomycetota bacterium]|nr:ComEA family DNA-binding protein [Actinomycetota bacterium]